MRRLTPLPDGSDHALFPSASCRPPQNRTRGSRGYTSHLPRLLHSQTRNSLKVSQPCGLKNDLLCNRPLRACSHLEHRELSCSGRAHCVTWVAQLYQKTSLVLCRWVTQASSTGLPEAFTCPATLDKPGRLGARSHHLSNLFWVARPTGLSENLSLSVE